MKTWMTNAMQCMIKKERKITEVKNSLLKVFAIGKFHLLVFIPSVVIELFQVLKVLWF